MSEILKQLFAYPTTEFIEHLNRPNNQRIVFSGKYGTGKTTFINYFFDESTQRSLLGSIKYIPVLLSPVNYSVANNEDIFQYIKFDILNHLLAREDVNLDDTDFSYLETAPGFIKANLHNILAPLMLAVPGVGSGMYKLYEKYAELSEKYEQDHKKLNRGEAKRITSFFKKLGEREGSIYEMDGITNLIIDLLKKLSAKCDSESEIVLVIDDLDRIDPHHIFRLFNIFAAHLNERGAPNKFGFNKIMFVCDINNIRRIFANNYGSDVDFDGYIDKFYSTRIHEFDNKQAIRAQLDLILDNTTIRSYGGHLVPKDQEVMTALKDLLSAMIQSGKLNLRSITKYYRGSIIIPYRDRILPYRRYNFHNWDVSAILLLQILKEIVGNTEYLKECLIHCQKYSSDHAAISLVLGDFILVLDQAQHEFKENPHSLKWRYNEIETKPNRRSDMIEYNLRRTKDGRPYVDFSHNSPTKMISIFRLLDLLAEHLEYYE